ncbi:small subunit ribosomal protein MRP21, partial [Lecanoromycetidae sp. Uapishka_2]
MEIRRLADPLMRSRALPSFSFLAPSIPQSWWLSIAVHQWHPTLVVPSKKFHKGFHSTACRSAESSPNARDSSKAGDLSFLEDPKTSPTKPTLPSPFQQKLKADSRLDNLLEDALDSIPNVRKSSPSEPRSSTELVADAYARNSVRQRERRKQGSFAEGMLFPPPSSSSSSSSSLSRSVTESLTTFNGSPKRAKRKIRSRPSVGRTVEVNQEKGMDFGSALRNLEIQCAVNRVRQDLQRQRFHERPGMKRKRLKSERWRKLFRESFKATVGRVKEMRRKGW